QGDVLLGVRVAQGAGRARRSGGAGDVAVGELGCQRIAPWAQVAVADPFTAAALGSAQLVVLGELGIEYDVVLVFVQVAGAEGQGSLVLLGVALAGTAGFTLDVQA